MQKIKTQKGITLVALIITIIVMLILVAVTLVITLGENGIIQKAKEASLKSNDRQNAEKDEFSSENAENNINDLVNEGKSWDINTGNKNTENADYYVCRYSDGEFFSAIKVINNIPVMFYCDGYCVDPSIFPVITMTFGDFLEPVSIGEPIPADAQIRVYDDLLLVMYEGHYYWKKGEFLECFLEKDFDTSLIEDWPQVEL